MSNPEARRFERYEGYDYYPDGDEPAKNEHIIAVCEGPRTQSTPDQYGRRSAEEILDKLRPFLNLRIVRLARYMKHPTGSGRGGAVRFGDNFLPSLFYVIAEIPQDGLSLYSEHGWMHISQSGVHWDHVLDGALVFKSHDDCTAAMQKLAPKTQAWIVRAGTSDPEY